MSGLPVGRPGTDFPPLAFAARPADELLDIRGVVVDTKDPPTPLVGVTVLVQGTVRGTTTDAEGFFSIKAKHGDVLTFSFIGYTGKEYRVNKSVANLSIAMEEELTSIDQVVVTGMTSQQRKHIAASVGAVAPSNFENKPITRLSQALQGGTTGILVTQSSGLPGGDGATIKIRGVASLLGSDPLVLVDGFEFDMDKLDPSTVESVSILKDAAAASIYGAKAGNGVILITTKRGSAGKVSVSYNGYFGIQQPIYLPDFVDGATYMEYINEANRNTTGVDKYTPEQIRITREGSDPIHYPSTDWMKETMRETAPIHEHNFTVSGGNTTARFALSAQYLNQDGMYKVMDNGFERLTVRANTTVNLNKDIMMFVDMFVGRDTQRQPETMNKTILDYIYLAPPTLVSKYPRKEGQKPGYDYYGVYFEWMNPLANLERGTQVESVRDYVTINARPTWHIIPGLTLKGQVGYRIASGMDKKDRNAYVFLDYFSGNESGTFGAVKSATYTTRTSYWMVGAMLDWTKEFGDHRINILGGWNEEVDRRNGWDDVALLSFFGKAYYSYKDKYLAEVGIRRDGSSLFGDGHKWGNFPSVAVGWNVNREPWMQNARFIDNFKIRASYGMLGNNNVALYRYQTIIDNSGNEIVNGNPDLTWEKVKILDAGVDLSLFGQKLEVTFDWFRKVTDDMIVNVPSTPSSGLLAAPMNVGKAEVKGYEIGVGFNHSFTKDIDFSINLGLLLQQVEVARNHQRRAYQRQYDLSQGTRHQGVLRLSGRSPAHAGRPRFPRADHRRLRRRYDGAAARRHPLRGYQRRQGDYDRRPRAAGRPGSAQRLLRQPLVPLEEPRLRHAGQRRGIRADLLSGVDLEPARSGVRRYAPALAPRPLEGRESRPQRQTAARDDRSGQQCAAVDLLEGERRLRPYQVHAAGLQLQGAGQEDPCR